MVVPMKTKSLLSIEREKIHVDSALLFQRLIAVYSLEELSTAFGYELSTRLFDKDNLMNEADKPKLKHALSKLLPETVHVIRPNSKYVLDGGSLMHKLQWTVGDTFAQICQAYVTYIKKRYGHCPTTVFDGGYDATSKKDAAHVRQAKGRIGKTLRLHLNNQLSMSKSNFFLSKGNNQNFLLKKKTDIVVNHGSGDADLLIVQTALKAAKDYRTVLIGEDTDLLVLALHYFTNEKALYFTYEPKQSQQYAEAWNIGHAKQILGKICHGILVIHAFS